MAISDEDPRILFVLVVGMYLPSCKACGVLVGNVELHYSQAHP